MTRHDLDLFSLFSGLVLTLIALAALFGVGIGAAAWIWPTILIALGGVVIASVLTSSRTGDQPGPEAADVASDPERAAAMAAARDEVEKADHTTD